MPDEPFAMLVERVAAFHITDRSMRQAQDAVAQALAAGTLDERQRLTYLDAVRRYFGGFEREARAQLREVDGRLEHANQVLFNLTAERAVVTKRIEATCAVLEHLDSIEERRSP